MDLLAVIDDMRHRISRLEEDNVSTHDRLGKVEDKCSGAWKTINEQKTEIRDMREEMRQMRNKLDGVEADVKSLKQAQNRNENLLKVIIALLCLCLVICVSFFVYIWRHDAELAKSILALGSSAMSVATKLPV